MNENIIEAFGGRGEKILRSNIQANEKVISKLKGSYGEGLVITDQHIYLIKWGFMAGNIIGGNCIAFNYANLVGIDVRKKLLTGTLELLSSATRDIKGQWRLGRRRGAIESNYIIAFSSAKFKEFQAAALLGRELIANHHNQVGKKQVSVDISQLEELANLKERGVITEEEFSKKKKQLLGI